MKKTALKKLSLSKCTIRYLGYGLLDAVIGGKPQGSHDTICPPGPSNIVSQCTGCPSEGDNC